MLPKLSTTPKKVINPYNNFDLIRIITQIFKQACKSNHILVLII